MKKSILDLGKVLDKAEQKQINGGCADQQFGGNCVYNTCYGYSGPDCPAR